jgi:hypothetical protein
MSLVLDRTPAVTRGEKVPVAGSPLAYGARSGESWGPMAEAIFQLSGHPGRRKQQVREILPRRMPPDSGVRAFLEAVMASWAHTRTVGVLSLEPGEDEPWVAKNRRRGYLIDKKHAGGLAASEAKELEELQAEMHHYVRASAPLSFEVLEDFEARAREIGITIPEY